ncbi:MAG: MFS transporter, partial [Candidatus Eremiobacteraeota bacterium]|nr:MFS transporter [Candidatus Eremiobacteraeota bacterium]
MAPAPGGERLDAYAPLRIPAFLRYTVATLTLTLATQIQTVIVAWQVYGVTHDPLSLGLIGLSEALPFIGVALWAGHIADRYDRRMLVLASTAALLGSSAALLALSVRPPATATLVRAIYGVTFASGIARSFLQPARQALVSEIVPRALLPGAVTWRSVTWQTAAVGGPALGGLLYGFAGPPTTYAVALVLMVAAFIAFAAVRHTPTPRTPRGEPVMQSLREGIDYLRTQPVLVGAMALDLFSVLFGGATALLPVFADRILHVGPEGLGVLRAAPAAGAVVVAFALAHRPPVRNPGVV